MLVEIDLPAISNGYMYTGEYRYAKDDEPCLNPHGYVIAGPTDYRTPIIAKKWVPVANVKGIFYSNCDSWFFTDGGVLLRGVDYYSEQGRFVNATVFKDFVPPPVKGAYSVDNGEVTKL